MCSICNSSKKLQRDIEFTKKIKLTTSLQYDTENLGMLKSRIECGSMGYTLPIKANYCFSCGRDLHENIDTNAEINNS